MRARSWRPDLAVLLLATFVLSTLVGVAVGFAVNPKPGPGRVGPYISDPNNPTKLDTHWHAALGVYDCDHWMGDGGAGGAGTWNWPAATDTGSPARVYDPGMYAGLHSHDDGVIHMEPARADEAGRNATLGRYFAFGGWRLSAEGFSFLGTTRVDGDRCGGSTGTLQWEIGSWDGNTAPDAPQPYTVRVGNPANYKLFQDDIVVLAFLPPGKSIESIGNPPSLPNLAKALGAEGGVGLPTSTTMPAVAPSASVTIDSCGPGIQATYRVENDEWVPDRFRFTLVYETAAGTVVHRDVEHTAELPSGVVEYGSIEPAYTVPSTTPVTVPGASFAISRPGRRSSSVAIA